MLVFGFAMVAIMIWKPRGFVVKRDPSILLPQAGETGGGRSRNIGGEPIREVQK